MEIDLKTSLKDEIFNATDPRLAISSFLMFFYLHSQLTSKILSLWKGLHDYSIQNKEHKQIF